MANAPVITPDVPAGGISALTGDVTAGPGSGSQAAAIAAAAVKPAMISVTTSDDFTFPNKVVANNAGGDTGFTIKGTSHDVVFNCNKSLNDRLEILVHGQAAMVIDGDAGTIALVAYAIQGGSQPIRTNGQMSAGTQAPDASAILQADSTTQGGALPRMTTTQKLAISNPIEGLELYDLTLHKKCVFTGTVWETITSS